MELFLETLSLKTRREAHILTILGTPRYWNLEVVGEMHVILHEAFLDKSE